MTRKDLALIFFLILVLYIPFMLQPQYSLNMYEGSA